MKGYFDSLLRMTGITTGKRSLASRSLEPEDTAPRPIHTTETVWVPPSGPAGETDAIAGKRAPGRNVSADSGEVDEVNDVKPPGVVPEVNGPVKNDKNEKSGSTGNRGVESGDVEKKRDENAVVDDAVVENVIVENAIVENAIVESVRVEKDMSSQTGFVENAGSAMGERAPGDFSMESLPGRDIRVEVSSDGGSEPIHAGPGNRPGTMAAGDEAGPGEIVVKGVPVLEKEAVTAAPPPDSIPSQSHAPPGEMNELTLSIGNIDITVEEPRPETPPTPPPQTPPPQTPPAQTPQAQTPAGRTGPTVSPSRLGRHYLRVN